MRSPAGLLAACCLAMISIGLVTNLPALCLTAIAAELGLDQRQSGLFLSCALLGPGRQRSDLRPRGRSLGLPLPVGRQRRVARRGAVVGCRRPWAAPGLPRRRSDRAGHGNARRPADALGLRRLSESAARAANLLHAFYPIGMFLVVLTVLLLTWPPGIGAPFTG